MFSLEMSVLGQNVSLFFGLCVTIHYYTALLNAVECSVHLHGPSRLPVVNYFSIMTVAMHIMTAVKESLVTYQPQHTRLLSDVMVSGGLFLLINTMNAGKK